MMNPKTPLRGVIFDYGNTLIWLGPKRRSTRTDYADVVARPGAERLARFLVSTGILGDESAAADFVKRYLEIRERNRALAEETGREITARESLISALESPAAVAPSSEARLRKAVSESFVPEIEAVEALPGATETLDMLRRRGVKLALLSNCTDGDYVRTVVRRLGWEGYFDPFVVSADIGARKPLPEAFRPMLDRWELAPEEVAMVGDSLYHDVAGAGQLGLQTIHFTAIENPSEPAHRAAVRPDWTAASHAELSQLLIRLSA
ncbi:MAG: HAD family hydrolase [Candidatus Eisenbacteria bacterium]|uniref:HAD family hydrolase n=1 Tax=Eiseniibacteriota bacterium TaxID=2212470 RepID=A0A538TQX2_UNCEI|nr:MAG: HAD family hydrolase [Candidatus Eisenbacteria bacterium]